MRKLLPFASPLSILAMLIVWQVSANLHWINATLVPSPLQIAQTVLEQRAEFAQAASETCRAVAISFALASSLGLILALSLSTSEFLERAFLPIAIFFQTVPIIAIAPLLVIYFGFGLPTVIAAATIVGIFPVIASALVALNNTPPIQLELFAFYRATPLQILWHLRLPAAYLGVYSGLRIAAGLTVIGTVAGEFVAGGGLGALIDSARTQQRIDVVFGCLFLLALIGLSLIFLLTLANRLVQKWRPLLQAL